MPVYGSSGDLGRRVTERRAALGLSLGEPADRSGLDVGYLEYLEARGSGLGVPSGTVQRIAAALGTTTAELLGAGFGLAPGRSSPDRRAQLEVLTEDDCRLLLEPGGIGRFVLVDDDGPAAFPVNFRVVDGDVAFLTDRSSRLSAAADGRRVGFEVDRIDDAQREGWSVVIAGTVHRVVEPEEVRRLRSAGIAPWAAGARDLFVVVRPGTVTGRRIRIRQ